MSLAVRRQPNLKQDFGFNWEVRTSSANRHTQYLKTSLWMLLRGSPQGCTISDMSDAAPQMPPLNRRKFLVIVDQTPECKVALRFAARRAQHTGGIITLLYVVPPADFQQWAGVERVMREEAYQEAERALFEAAKAVNEIVGAMPELVTREGRTLDEVRALLKEDRAIAILV